jgi:hypothetical protein
MNDSQFLFDAIRHMADNGITVTFGSGKTVNDSSGWFEYPNLSVAMGNDDWFEVFIHEYCHFRQWLDEQKPGTWSLNYGPVSNEEFNSFFDWVYGKKELNPLEVTDLRKRIQLLEQDCDKRVVELINIHDLPVDIELYTQKSNAYHLSYTVVESHRKWFKAPYRIPEIVRIMPCGWLSEHGLNNPSKEFVNLMIQCC